MNAWSDLAARALGWIVTTSWQAAVLALVVVAVQWGFRRMLTARWRYLLWLLVVGRLLLPSLPESPTSLYRYVPSSPVPVMAMEVGSRIISPVVSRDVNESSVAAAPLSPAAPPACHLSWADVLFAIWMAGVLVLVAVLIWRNVVFRRLIMSEGRPAENLVSERAQVIARSMELRRPVSVIEIPGLDTPAVAGLFRPLLLLPQGLATHISADDLKMVFRHEIAHLKRGDLWINFLTSILQVVHWFNPVLWWAFSRMRDDRELATDALALSFSREPREAYGETLLKLASGPSVRVSLNPSIGILENHRHLLRRIEQIALLKPNAYAWSTLGAVLLIAVSLLALTRTPSRAATALSSFPHAVSPQGKYVASVERPSPGVSPVWMVRDARTNAVVGSGPLLSRNTKLETLTAADRVTLEWAYDWASPFFVLKVQRQDHLDALVVSVHEGPLGHVFCKATELNRDPGATVLSCEWIGDRNLKINRLLPNGKMDPVYTLVDYNGDFQDSDRPPDVEKTAILHLLSAVQENDAVEVRKILAAGFDIRKVRYEDGRSLLNETTSAEVAEILIQHGIDPNARSRNNYTTLALLCMSVPPRDESEVMRVVLNHGVDPNARFRGGNTAVMLAETGTMVDLLAAHGADVNARNDQGLTALDHAPRSDISSFLALLRHGAKFDMKKDGPMLLIDSAYWGNAPLVGWLLDHGADPNQPALLKYGFDVPKTVLPLVAADMYGRYESAEQLVEHGAKADDEMVPMIADGYSKFAKLFWGHGVRSVSPLCYAMSQGAPVSDLQALLDKGMPADPPQDNLLTPLAVAAHRGDLAAMRLLIARGADVNKGGWNPRPWVITYGSLTPLLLAASEGQAEAVDLLLRHGARPDWTALHEAAFNSHPFIGDTPEFPAQLGREHFERTVRLLIDAGALQNLTPEQKGNLLIAPIFTRDGSSGGNSTVLKMLLDAGLDPNSPFTDQLVFGDGADQKSVLAYFRGWVDRKRIGYVDNPQEFLDLLNQAAKKLTDAQPGGQSAPAKASVLAVSFPSAQVTTLGLSKAASAVMVTQTKELVGDVGRLYRAMVYTQTSSAAPQLGPTSYQFIADMSNNTFPVNGGTVSLPAGSKWRTNPVPLVKPDLLVGAHYLQVQGFKSEADLLANFPNGGYAFNIQPGATGAAGYSAPVGITGTVPYPPIAPVITNKTWDAGFLILDPTSAQINFTNYPGATLTWEIVIPGRTYVMSAGGGGTSLGSLNLTGMLSYGQTYDAQLRFINRDKSSTVSDPGSPKDYGFSTMMAQIIEFKIKTPPGPAQAATAPKTETVSAELAARQKELLDAQEDAAKRHVLYDSLKDLPDDQFVAALEGMQRATPKLTSLQDDILQKEGERKALLKQGFDSQHPRVQAIDAQLAQEHEQYKTVLAGLRTALKIDAEMADAGVALLQKTVDELKKGESHP